jgi:hypothetical protein
MNKATFIISEVAAYLESIKKPFAAGCLRQDWGNTVTNEDLQVWFQGHFGRESAYKLFREMECHVTQTFKFNFA